MILLIIFAFLAGFVTILSPCILPILPIVLSGSLSGGKKRPLGVVTGFIGSFTFFTLFLSAIVRNTGLPADFMRNLAIVMVFIFGIFLVAPQAQIIFEKLVSKLSSLQKTNTNTSSGFIGGIIVGLSLGLVWAPCVGPILASIITLSITAQVSLSAVLITMAYSLGTAIPMLVITYSGRKIFDKIPWLLEHTTQIQQMFGVLMIFTSIGLFMNIDTKFQKYILEQFPQYGAGLTQFEDKPEIQKQIDSLLYPDQNENKTESKSLLNSNTKAPGFQGEDTWINSEPLTLETDLKGQVILIDFWTYTCINCVRTLPYLRDWYSKYNEKGFEIIGVHSPEFEFEKVYDNVLNASKEYQLNYPIVLDNNFNIWKAYSNKYWPAHYLIDKNGEIRYTHFGEGNYVETENAIRELLDEKPIEKNEEIISRKKQTPEIYLGYQRAANYTNENSIQIDKTIYYDQIGLLPDDAVGLEGDWLVEEESITAGNDGVKLKLNFIATDVFLVLHPNKDLESDSKITIILDGKQIKTTQISKANKYDIVSLEKNDYGRHSLEIIFSKGTSAFAFTFGNK